MCVLLTRLKLICSNILCFVRIFWVSCRMESLNRLLFWVAFRGWWSKEVVSKISGHPLGILASGAVMSHTVSNRLAFSHWGRIP